MEWLGLRVRGSQSEELQILTIGFLSGSIKRKAMKESLFKAGAGLVIQHPRDLLHLVKPIDQIL